MNAENNMSLSYGNGSFLNLRGGAFSQDTDGERASHSMIGGHIDA